jgi:8-amino-7-oxononanoate synthase
VLDFTSALYLGLAHPSAALPPWARLTTGAPAALVEPPGSPAVGRSIAALTGCERAVLATSTLHLFWDLFPILAGPEEAIYVDAGAYPIARWGVERAAARGAVTQTFAHHDVGALRRLLRRSTRRPLVLVDGLCPDCGRPAPLAAYVDAVAGRDGSVVVDDTQGLGILGSAPGPGAPYGRGGGGAARLYELRGAPVIVAGSLAKGFGAPVAILAGPAGTVARYEAESETRTSCSPPSTVAIRAAAHALAVNAARGDALRLRLATRVRQFRDGLAARGLRPGGGRYPIQTVVGVDGTDLHARLLEQLVRTVLRGPAPGRVTFLITARHSAADVDRALGALEIATRGGARRRARRNP